MKFRLKKTFDIKNYFIITILSVLLSIYLFEYYLTHKKNKNIIENYKVNFLKKKYNKEYDRRKLYEIYNDLTKDNQDFAITVYPRYFLKIKNLDFLPLSGISNINTINCNENGYYSINKSDRYGFNNPDEEWDKKNIEYVLIGDSFGHGACVNRPNDIGSQLREISNKSVINLSYTANGPLLEYATLREYFKTNFKKIIWLYYEGNDLDDLSYELNIPLLKNYLIDEHFSQNLYSNQDKIDEFSKKQINSILNYKKKLDKKDVLKYKILKFLRLNNTKKILRKKSFVDTKNLEEILIKVKKMSIENNVKFYFVYLPDYYRYKNEEKYNENYKNIKKMVNKLNLNFIDIHRDLFAKKEKPLTLFPFQLPGHFNKEAYREISEILYQFTK